MISNTKDQNLALFKFSLIAPLVNETFVEPSKNAFFRSVASKTYHVNGKDIRFSASTIKHWYSRYLKYGLDGLYTKTRSDLGDSRKLNYSVRSRILEILEQFPYITSKAVYQKLIEEGIIGVNDVSLSTITRFVKHNFTKPTKQVLESKAFEMMNPNDMWQADTSVGPYIEINGKKTKTYLIMFIDDSSRLITGFSFFTQDNAVNMQFVFKNALLKYGKPKRLYVDNGAPYKNGQLSLICASLGVALIHAKPYTPTSKGKVERAFRTIKDGWMHRINWNDFNSLEELNNSLFDFINNYHHKIHSSLKSSPLDKFQTHLDNIKYVESSILEQHFLHRFTRKVKNDSTVSINKVHFEVPSKYIGVRIEIRHYPLDLDKAYIYTNDEIITIKPVKKIDNSKIKRSEVNYGGVLT